MRGKHVEALLPELGSRLYEAVFGSLKNSPAFQAWHSQETSLRQVSVISEIPRVLNLPWELLHDEHTFLTSCRPHPVSFVRRLPQKERVASLTSLPFEPPLRVLLVSPRPANAGFVDPRSIARELLEEMHDHIEAGEVEIEILRPPTFSALRTHLDNRVRPVHVLHFDGHGSFNEDQEKQRMLAFENDGEWINFVRARDMKTVLHQCLVIPTCVRTFQMSISSSSLMKLRKGSSCKWRRKELRFEIQPRLGCWLLP